MAIFLNILFLVIGFALLVFGADWFVGGASGIAKKARVSEMVIALTIVAFGTSAPEAAVSITAAISGSAGITVGNVLGSNILNVLLILGLSACIRPLSVKKSTLWIEIPFLAVITVLMVLLGYFGTRLGRVDGAILLCLFAVFLVYTVLMAKKTRTAPLLETACEKAVAANETAVIAAGKVAAAQTAAAPNAVSPASVQALPAAGLARLKAGWDKLMNNLWFVIFLTAAGLGFVVVGSMFAVGAAKNLAAMAGVSDAIIGLTIVALGTSLPELVTSVVAAVKGKSDIAVGNIIGSNIFNIVFVVGMASVIMPVDYANTMLFDGLVAIGTVVILFLGSLGKKRCLGRIPGVLMMASFAAYWTLIILRGTGILSF